MAKEWGQVRYSFGSNIWIWKMFLDYPFGSGFHGHHVLRSLGKYGLTSRLTVGGIELLIIP